VTCTVHEYDHDPAVASYGSEAAEALGIEARRVHKTLVASVELGGREQRVVAGVPVDAQHDLKALAASVGGKRAAMADPAAAERATGDVVGGISPRGQKKAVATVVDADALAFPTVFVSGGRRGLEIELAPADLVRLTKARTAPIARR
jgi:Cys-tRNA(Pro)/Cys-tRNA(Cys) deacylase